MPCCRLYAVYAGNDAELVEINPLVVTKDGDLVALDCKLTIDDSALPAPRSAGQGGHARTADRARDARHGLLDLKFIELDGSVGVLANGAGLTMTTMDAVRHFGGSPANFMEIGGESYTKANAGARTRALQPARQMPARQLLRRVRAHRRDGRWRDQGLAGAEAQDPDLLHHPRHRRGRGDRHGQGAARHHAVRPDGRCRQGRSRRCRGRAHDDRPRQRNGARAGHHRQAGHLLVRAHARLRHQDHRRRQSQARRRGASGAAGVGDRTRCRARDQHRRRGDVHSAVRREGRRRSTPSRPASARSCA